MTGSQIWFDAAARLYREGIAKPVLWLGDDFHFEKAIEMFGDDVQMEPNTIVVPDTIPASLLEVEYKPSQWTSIDEAIKQLK